MVTDYVPTRFCDMKCSHKGVTISPFNFVDSYMNVKNRDKRAFPEYLHNAKNHLRFNYGPFLATTIDVSLLQPNAWSVDMSVESWLSVLITVQFYSIVMHKLTEIMLQIKPVIWLCTLVPIVSCCGYSSCLINLSLLHTYLEILLQWCGKIHFASPFLSRQ